MWLETIPVVEKYLEALMLAMDDIIDEEAEGRAVINMSIGFKKSEGWPDAFYDMLGTFFGPSYHFPLVGFEIFLFL